MKTKPYVIERDGRYGVQITNTRPSAEGAKVHGAFKTVGGAIQFAAAANAGEIITHAVAERRAAEALSEGAS